MRFRTCEVAFDNMWIRTCVETRVDVIVSAVARVQMLVSVGALYVCE